MSSYRFVKQIVPMLSFLIMVSAVQLLSQNNLTCYQCKKAITGKYIIAEGKTFHPNHFLCARCNRIIDGNYQYKDGDFYHMDCYAIKEGLICGYCKKILSGNYVVYQNKKYHQDCCRNHVLEKCSICGQPLEGEFIIDNFNNRYHAGHKNELPECDCCNRLICKALTGGSKRYSDGRNICNICYGTAVFDDYQISSLLSKVKNKLITMGLKIGPNPISIRGVDRNELKRNAKNYSRNTQGYCDSRSDIMTINGAVKSKITKHKIMVLNGIPQILMESIIAHELMHAWIYDNTKNNQDLKTLEGSCNYIRYLYLKTLLSSQSEQYIQRMNRDPDPAYGTGFREIRERFEGKRLDIFLNFLKAD